MHSTLADLTELEMPVAAQARHAAWAGCRGARASNRDFIGFRVDVIEANCNRSMAERT